MRLGNLSEGTQASPNNSIWIAKLNMRVVGRISHKMLLKNWHKIELASVCQLSRLTKSTLAKGCRPFATTKAKRATKVAIEGANIQVQVAEIAANWCVSSGEHL